MFECFALDTRPKIKRGAGMTAGLDPNIQFFSGLPTVLSCSVTKGTVIWLPGSTEVRETATTPIVISGNIGPRGDDYDPVKDGAGFRRDFDPDRYRIVELKSQAAGILKIVQKPDRLWLRSIFLLPEFQNRGLGTKLLRDLQDQARALKLDLVLRVLKVNPAQQLYLRLGFQFDGDTDVSFWMRWRSS